MSTTNVPIYNVAAGRFEAATSDVPLPNVPLSSTVNRTKVDSKQRTKNQSKQTVTRSEMIPGHRGDLDVDDLVNFINGPPNNANEKPKKSKN